jgi:hypothetical protein
LLERVLGLFMYVRQSLQNAKRSIKRIRQTVFGARTEDKRDGLEDPGAKPAQGDH